MIKWVRRGDSPLKKAVLIILSVIVILSVFSVTVLAAPVEGQLLRAGGSIGGGGGGLSGGGFCLTEQGYECTEKEN